MKNENKKLNPMTCDLQVGDLVEVVICEEKQIAQIVKIDNESAPFEIKTKTGWIAWCKRSELILISRNGKPIEELSEKKFFANVYDNGNGRFLSHDYDSFEEAYENREDISTYIETVEIVRHKKPAPKIDFGKAGLILTDGDVIVVTTGEERDDNFEAHCLFELKYDALARLKNKPWRDITADAQPLLEQIKILMNGK